MISILKSTQTKARVKPESDFCHGVRQLLLDQLVSRQRFSKLLAVKGVLAGGGHAELSGPKNTPGDTKPSETVGDKMLKMISF